jgi:hypothetical protein
MLDPVYYASLAAYMALLMISIWQVRACRARGEPYSWMVLALHGIVYYAAFFVDRMDGGINAQFWNIWSSSLRLHALITIVVIEFFRMKRMGVKHGC